MRIYHLDKFYFNLGKSMPNFQDQGDDDF